MWGRSVLGQFGPWDGVRPDAPTKPEDPRTEEYVTGKFG